MQTRFVPDAPTTWLVYQFGSVALALPPGFRSAADAVLAAGAEGADAVLAGLRAAVATAGVDFALLEASADGLRVVLRGPATVTVGDEIVTGLGAAERIDRTVAASRVVRLSVPGGEWTFVAEPAETAAAPVPPPLGVREEVTAVPEIESSAPAGPPALLGAAADGADATGADDRAAVVDEIARIRGRRTPAPTLILELPDGSREPLDPAVVLGRAPRAGSGTRGVRLPEDADISRTHARVALEGGTVVVTDLGSLNGTVVRIPGRPAQRLRDGEPTPVLVGTIIDFGGGIELAVREA